MAGMPATVDSSAQLSRTQSAQKKNMAIVELTTSYESDNCQLKYFIFPSQGKMGFL